MYDLTFYCFFTGKTLTSLSLLDNKIDNLPADYFLQSGALTTVDLDGNALMSLPDMSHTAIRQLSLRGNRFQNLDFLMVKKLENLETLDIRGNQMDSVDLLELVTWAPRLSFVDVAFNNLTTLENVSGAFCDDVIPFFNGTIVDATSNPYHCGENLLW